MFGCRVFHVMILAQAVVWCGSIACQTRPDSALGPQSSVPAELPVVAEGSEFETSSAIIQDVSGNFIMIAAVERSQPPLAKLVRVNLAGEASSFSNAFVPASSHLIQESISGDFIVASTSPGEDDRDREYMLLRISESGEVTTILASETLGIPLGFVEDGSSGDFLVISADTIGGGPSQNPRLSRVKSSGEVSVIASDLPLTFPVAVISDSVNGDLVVLDNRPFVDIDAESAALVRITRQGEVTVIMTAIRLVNAWGVTQDIATGDFIVTDFGSDPDESATLIRITSDGSASAMIPLGLLRSPRGVVQDRLSGDFIVVDVDLLGANSRLVRVAEELFEE